MTIDVKIIDDLIQNPLFQGVVIAIVTVFLIPWYTRQWADRQQELSIKNNLIDQISQSVTNIFESMSFRFPQDDCKRQESFKAWRSQSAVIGAELRTYFTDSMIIDYWNQLYYSTTNIFLLFEGLDKKRSKNQLDEIKKYFPKSGNIKWELIEKHFVENKGTIDYTNDELWNIWHNLYTDLNALKYKIIKKTVKENIAVFSHGISLPKKKERPADETNPT